MKFRKRPVVVDAVQFHIDEHFDGKRVHEDIPGVKTRLDQYRDGQPPHRVFYIDTPEGPHTVSDGDWIITGVAGEHYPCKPDIFEASYEPVATAIEA